MSCYLIKVENGHKVARSITSEEEYKQLRGSNEQKANLRLARAGNDAAKRRLVQFNYSGHYPQGVVKGMKLPSGAFGFDMDEPEAFAKAAKLLLKEPDKYGLLMLERSARQGGHAVFEREKGKTILENQVRIATMLKCEMDTSAHDINRVYFTTTSDDEDLLFLSPRLFKDEYDEAAVAAEGKVLEERERYGQEKLPEGAHKANKHYEPWKEEFKKDSQGVLKGQEFKNSRISTSATSASAASTSSTASTTAASTTSAAQDNYLGIPYGEIIKKWWQRGGHLRTDCGCGRLNAFSPPRPAVSSCRATTAINLAAVQDPQKIPLPCSNAAACPSTSLLRVAQCGAQAFCRKRCACLWSAQPCGVRCKRNIMRKEERLGGESAARAAPPAPSLALSWAALHERLWVCVLTPPDRRP